MVGYCHFCRATPSSTIRGIPEDQACVPCNRGSPALQPHNCIEVTVPTPAPTDFAAMGLAQQSPNHGQIGIDVLEMDFTSTFRQAPSRT
jgi:hypothetical protein